MLHYAEQTAGVTDLKLFPSFSCKHAIPVLAFPANMPCFTLIIKVQLKINVKPDRQIFQSLKYSDIYQMLEASVQVKYFILNEFHSHWGSENSNRSHYCTL